ncbi:hypothetical protein COBT_002697 [Conglomerata obtusa]
MLEDYEILYNECFKCEEVNFGKTSLVFIALKLNENEKQTFNNFNPMNYIINNNKIINSKIYFEAIYLQKRSPLGDFSAEENSNCILGKKIVKKYTEHEIVSHDVCFKTKINKYFENQRIINSMQCIIGFSYDNNNQNKNHELSSNVFINREDSIVLTILFEDKLIKFNIHYITKLIEDKKTEKKKVFMINVYIHTNWRYNHEKVSEYAYFMSLCNGKISYSFLNDKKLISDDMINQHHIARNLFSNLKLHICSSLMHLDIYFDYIKIMDEDYTYVVSGKASTLSAIKVPWDHLNIKNSINTLLSKLKFDNDLKPSFVLYKYELSFLIFDEQRNKKNFNMFNYASYLTRIKEIFDGFELDETHEEHDFCLQICLFEGYTQYYYLFLPTHELQLLYNGFSKKKILLLFGDLLEDSKKNLQKTVPPRTSIFYNYVIEEINQLSHISYYTILSYFKTKHDRELEFFIYIAIAVRAKKYTRLTNLYDILTKEELTLLNKIKIPRCYYQIKIINNSLYNKIKSNLFFRIIHSLVHNTIIDCSQQLSNMINTIIYNKPEQACYLQCRNDFPVFNQKTIIQKLSAAN